MIFLGLFIGLFIALVFGWLVIQIGIGTSL